MGKKNKKGALAERADRHALYEASVQDVETEIRFLQRIFKSKRKTLPLSLREDFCGTALLASSWAARGRDRRAWGIDLDPEVLDWARTRRVPYLKTGAERLKLIEGDVRSVRTPRGDVLAALNFSYFCFLDRDTMRAYFQCARAQLKKNGMMLLDVYGGNESGSVKKDSRKVPATRLPDGTHIPGFKYTWHQARFNPVDHHTRCHIHFKLPDGSRMKKAFTYGWRLWTLPELKELLLEAGFPEVDVFIHGFDEDGTGNDHYRKRTYYENTLGWIAYLAAWNG